MFRVNIGSAHTENLDAVKRRAKGGSLKYLKGVGLDTVRGTVCCLINVLFYFYLMISGDYSVLFLC